MVGKKCRSGGVKKEGSIFGVSLVETKACLGSVCVEGLGRPEQFVLSYHITILRSHMTQPGFTEQQHNAPSFFLKQFAIFHAISDRIILKKNYILKYFSFKSMIKSLPQLVNEMKTS